MNLKFKNEAELNTLLNSLADEELKLLRAALLKEKPNDHFSRKLRFKILEILDERGTAQDKLAAEMKAMKAQET